MAGLGSGHPQMTSEAQQAYDTFWPKVNEEIRTMTIGDLKHQELPLARIKKIMKLDEDVKMISAEAPVLFAKAAEIFIHELTMRAWIHTEDNKRRTLQRNDIAMAITKYDQFDFLIDIVPRDDIKPTPKATDGSSGRMMPDQVGYYLQLAQQHQQSLQSNQPTTQQQQQHTQPQVVQPAASAGVQTIAVANSQHSQVAPQVIQLQPQQMTNQAAPPPGGIQIVQQIMGPNGEIQQIPIQLSQQQLQVIRSQMIGGTTQPVVIQTAPIQAVNSQPTQQLQQQVYLQQEWIVNQHNSCNNKFIYNNNEQWTNTTAATTSLS